MASPFENTVSSDPRALRWRLVRWTAGGALIAGIGVVFYNLPGLRHGLGDHLDSFAAQGAWGVICYLSLYLPSTLAFLPAWPLSVTAGYVFGVAKGWVVISAGTTTAACFAFLLGRFLARDWILARIWKYRRIQALDQAVADHGFKIVALSRLSPILPSAMLNYGFAVSKVPFWKYALASWLGMLPSSVVYAYVGFTARTASELVEGRAAVGLAQKAIYLAGLAATVAVVVITTRISRRALREAIH